MHIHFLDPYRHRESPLHALDARLKFVFTLAFILSVSLTPPAAWPVYILLLALVMSAAIISGLGLPYTLKRSALALPFVLAALPVLFTLPGDPLFSLRLGPWTLVASVPGLERFISVALKSWISVQAAVLLAASTQFPHLLHAMRAVGIPRLLVAMFGLTWRYIFVLVDEALRLLRARQARSGHLEQPGARPGGSLSWRARVTGGMAGNLFLRAFERSDRIYVAMLSRGYDGEVRTLPSPRLAARDWALLLAAVAFLGLLLLIAFLFWG